jgi:tetratricopeptide (TPR) repeat protein
VSATPEGYHPIPPEDRKKAKAFFDRGTTVAGTGNYEYAIEMYLQGLAIDPDAIEAHQTLRDISMKRKASGGKALGMFEAMKLKRNTKDDKQNMLNAEKLLGYDPGNTDHMLSLAQAAQRGGYWDTVMWIGPILRRANTDSPKPDFNKFIALKEIYKGVGQWKFAADAAQDAAMLRPEDMDLQHELKHLGAQQTMESGKYGEATTFRESVKDMDAQRKLFEADSDVRTGDAMARQIADAEAEWKAQPDEVGKLNKLVDALVRSEDPANENRAIDLLAVAFERTKQFRFRLNVGKIKLTQLNRAERAMRERVQADRENKELVEEYRLFFQEKTEEELREFTLWAENYPTDLSFKYEMAKRLFLLKRYDEAIPAFQTSRQDPKIRTDASTYLGRAFLEAGFVDEAVETLRGQIEDYQLKGDNRSKDMYYWYARALELHKDFPAAIKAYSQVAQWDFNYRDVQARIKKLRTQATTT